MFQIAYRRLLMAGWGCAPGGETLRISDQQSPVRNLEHRSSNILILHAFHRLRLEAVTDLADRVNVDRVARVFFNLRAQRCYAAIDAAAGDDHGPSPYGIQDIVARKR